MTKARTLPGEVGGIPGSRRCEKSPGRMEQHALFREQQFTLTQMSYTRGQRVRRRNYLTGNEEPLQGLQPGPKEFRFVIQICNYSSNRGQCDAL